MDRYTKKIHFLLTVVSDLRQRYSVTVYDIEDVIVWANMISERILGKEMFDTREGFCDVLRNALHTLAKNGAILIKNYDEVKEMEESGAFLMGKRKHGEDEFIFVEHRIWEKPSWITLNEAIAMELGTYAAYLEDDELNFYGSDFVSALAWAAKVQKEVIKKQAKKIDK